MSKEESKYEDGWEMAAMIKHRIQKNANGRMAECTLNRPGYVAIKKDGDVFYGGSQMWYEKNGRFSNSDIIRSYGCGTIAAGDLFLYLALQDAGRQNRITRIAMKDGGSIMQEHYISYLDYIDSQYTKTKRWIGVTGPKLASALNRYFRFAGIEYEASWAWSLTSSFMLERIEEMIKADIPVILSVGPNTPILWGDAGIPFYLPVNTENAGHVERRYVKSANSNVHGHYVTVTGVIPEPAAGRIMLCISSWGRKYYMDYDEYRNYVAGPGGKWTSSMVYVRKKERIRDLSEGLEPGSC